FYYPNLSTLPLFSLSLLDPLPLFPDINNQWFFIYFFIYLFCRIRRYSSKKHVISPYCLVFFFFCHSFTQIIYPYPYTKSSQLVYRLRNDQPFSPFPTKLYF